MDERYIGDRPLEKKKSLLENEMSEIQNILRLLKNTREEEILVEMEKSFENILNNRHPERVLSINDLSDACLLCSEPLADKCHRRLVAEYFKRVYPDISIIHL